MYRDRQAPWGRPSTVAASLALLLLCLSVAPTGAYPAGPAGPPRAAVARPGAPRPGQAVNPWETRPTGVPRAGSPDAAPPLTCDGPRDLDVDGFKVALSGAQAFDRVCVTGGGTIVVTDALTLRADALYVDAGSGIEGDGGDLPPSLCYDGLQGADITILAHRLTLEGTLSSDGGNHLDRQGWYACLDSTLSGPKTGDEANAGNITLQTLALTLTGHISAHGGDGGGDMGSNSNSNSGAGGTVTINVPASVLANLNHGRVDVNVDGGGKVVIGLLTTAQQAVLPPAPPPLIGPLAEGGPPARRVPVAAFARGMRCGAGDLDIGAGRSVVLRDTRRYAHVCVHDGGVLEARPRLVLLAQTIMVDASSHIEADGVISATPSDTAKGDYSNWDRGIPPAGVSGVCMTDEDGYPGSGARPGELEGPARQGGAGGGRVALIARRILIAGTVSANGGDNQNGTDAAGGAGGGILLRADALQLTGTVAVRYGQPGNATGYPAIPCPPGGGNGRVTILADALYAPPGGPRVIGGALLGHTLPTDPAPPAADPAALYVPATLHSLSGPFLAYWRAHGGLPALGYPLADPFAEGGRLVQYTQRAELVATPAGITLAPLGRLLTAGRTFAPVAPFRSTPDHVYVAATGHGLAGAFLTYWRAHHGADLLGAPLSEPLVEGNDDGSGRRYLLQWFERGRLELHAEYPGAPYVQAGLLGARALQRRGWLP